jgi:hypothetical protein
MTRDVSPAANSDTRRRRRMLRRTGIRANLSGADTVADALGIAGRVARTDTDADACAA